MHRIFGHLVFVFLFLHSAILLGQDVVVPDLSKLKYIDAYTVLTSPEYTFQDQTMVDEPGRMTVSSEYKLNKAKLFASGYLKDSGLDFEAAAIPNLDAFKAGYYMKLSPKEKWYVDSEPVCIEVNHSPRNIYGVAKVAPGIFKTAKEISLVPYINPAAERSGMGHIHIGGQTLGDSPFYKNPQLLRNVMVYFHKHPSLLWGFGEAFDIGQNSNIESYHTGNREIQFSKAVSEFDEWFAKASPIEKSNGLQKFLEALTNHLGQTVFQHYRVINLEHLEDVTEDFRAERSGKLTVEFRGFRPPKTAQHAVSDIAMLLKVFDHLSTPDFLEPFEVIGNKYERFFSASKVAADWEIVAKETNLTDPVLTEMIFEYVYASHDIEHKIKGIKGARLFNAFSEKNLKGLYYELLVPVTDYPTGFDIQVGEQFVNLEKIKVQNVDYWTGILRLDSSQTTTLADIKRGALKARSANKCAYLFAH